MYQGKYLAGAKSAKTPRPAPEKKPQEALPEEVTQTPVDETPVPKAVRETPVKRSAPQKPAKEKKKRNIVGTLIFYVLYVLLIIAAVIAIRYGLGLMEDWLVRYEASQPDTKSQEIFEELFADPDWGKIYTLAGLEGTQFEGKEAYVAYMEQKVGDAQLICTKTSAGLSGGQKYIVKLGDEKLATFTMQNPVTSDLEIPQWELSTVEAGFFTRNEAVTVTTLAGRTVTLNGVPLDESYVVKTTSSNVDPYLPEGIHGPRTSTVHASGFLVPPTVAVIDENGTEVTLTHDPDTNTYTEAAMNSEAQQISAIEEAALVDATKAYCRHMIGATGARLSSYFDTSSDIYKTITRNELWFKGYASYEFTEPKVSEYHSYSETLFSAKIQLTLNVYRKDGSVKPFDIDTTMFLTKPGSKWVVNNMTNVELHKTLTHVRLTWMADGQVLSSIMVDAEEKLLTPPAVTAPEGKVFAGWFLESVDAEGNTTLSLVFAPTEAGSISLPEDYTLEPMVLQARFESQGE